LKPDRLDRLDALRTGDGRPLPERLTAEIRRELARIDGVASQLATVERARDALVRPQTTEPTNPSALLIKRKGVGIEFASRVWREGLFRSFTNRRHVAAYAGLAPRP
jgi:transposase